jgi:hypothetical protein
MLQQNHLQQSGSVILSHAIRKSYYRPQDSMVGPPFSACCQSIVWFFAPCMVAATHAEISPGIYFKGTILCRTTVIKFLPIYASKDWHSLLLLLM